MNYLFNGIWADPDNNRFLTQDGEAHINLEDAEAHMDSNYWTQEELPMQKVIDDLRDVKVENFGVLPEYYARPLNNEKFDLFDSSTWMVPEKWTNDPLTQEFYNTYVGAEGAKVPMSTREWLGAIRPIDEKKVLAEIDQMEDSDEKEARIDEFEQRILDQDIAHEKYGKNIIDVLAKDNPEIRTGFFPRTYYPEIGPSNLENYLAKGFRVRKTGIDKAAAGHYNPRYDEIAMSPTKEGLLPDWQRVLEIMGHEGGWHYSYPNEYEETNPRYLSANEGRKFYPRRGLDALEHTLPWPNNWSNKWTGSWTYPHGAGHEAGIFADQMFFPTGVRQGEWHNLNKKGVENLNAIMNWKKNMTPRSTFLSKAREKREQEGITHMPASNIDYTAPDRGDWGRGLHLSTGGLVSLVL